MRTNSFLLFGASILFVVGCSDPIKPVIQAESTISPTAITLNSTLVSLNPPAIGPSTTTQLLAAVEPVYAQPPIWESSNTLVATVNDSGLVTSVRGGSATITARNAAGTVSASATVSVILSYSGWTNAGTGSIRAYPDAALDIEIGGTSPVNGPASTVAAYNNTLYPSAKPITLEAASTWEGGSIYYTTDGTTPTTSSTLYTGPIQLTASKTIKAFATKVGQTDSAVLSFVYNVYRIHYFVHAGWFPNTISDVSPQGTKDDPNYVLGYYQGSVDQSVYSADGQTGKNWGPVATTNTFSATNAQNEVSTSDSIGQTGAVSRILGYNNGGLVTYPQGAYIGYKFEMPTGLQGNATKLMKLTVGLNPLHSNFGTRTLDVRTHSTADVTTFANTTVNTASTLWGTIFGSPTAASVTFALNGTHLSPAGNMYVYTKYLGTLSSMIGYIRISVKQ